MIKDIYSFIFRGLLTEEALERAGANRRAPASGTLDQVLFSRLPIDALDPDLVKRATRMAVVYVAIAAFENSVREFVAKRLLEEVGADWWDKSVPEGIRKKAESRQETEIKTRWHTPRGDQPLNYTEFGELASIIGVGTNWPRFENHIHSIEWARQIFKTLEFSRNVIMHSGDLSNEDVERVGTAMRDWISQVGA